MLFRMEVSKRIGSCETKAMCERSHVGLMPRRSSPSIIWSYMFSLSLSSKLLEMSSYHCSIKRVVESFQQRDDSTLAATGRTHKCKRLSGLDRQIQSFKDSDIRSLGVAEEDFDEIHSTADFRALSILRHAINVGLFLEHLENQSSGEGRFRVFREIGTGPSEGSSRERNGEQGSWNSFWFYAKSSKKKPQNVHRIVDFLRED